jgi:hypothetical protein
MHRSRITASLLALVAAAALSGCGDDGGPTEGTGAATSTTTATETTTAAAPTSTRPASPGTTAGRESAVLADGRHPVHLKTVNPDRRRVTFDLVSFFTGEAAAEAAKEDGQESPPPNDYYIRNTNSRLRTLPVRQGAPVTVNVLASSQTGNSTRNVTVSLDRLARYQNLDRALFWITVRDGQVTRLAEQFLP